MRLFKWMNKHNIFKVNCIVKWYYQRFFFMWDFIEFNLRFSWLFLDFLRIYIQFSCITWHRCHYHLSCWKECSWIVYRIVISYIHSEYQVWDKWSESIDGWKIKSWNIDLKCQSTELGDPPVALQSRYCRRKTNFSNWILILVQYTTTAHFKKMPKVEKWFFIRKEILYTRTLIAN